MRLSRLFPLPLLLALPAFASGPLTGTVTNGTTGKPAAGDTVALIAFGQGMQVAAQTTTDAQGRYTLNVPDDSMHLVRVDHQKAAYFTPAPPGTHTADVEVYNVAPAVNGVSTVADVLAVDTTPGGLLHVTEDFFVNNDSKPPLTQFSDHAYPFVLPAGAKLEGSAAMGPGGMPVDAMPVPQAQANHYAFLFPIRPGSTRFQVTWTLPYSGSYDWTEREPVPVADLIVMLPQSVRFAPKGTDWQPVQEKNLNAQVFVRKGVAPETPVAFTLAGTGSLPRDAESGAAASGQQAGETARPGGGLGPPIDTPDPLHRYKIWLLAGLGLALLALAWLLSRRPKDTPPARSAAADGFEPELDMRETPTPRPRGLRASLESALLALERDHAEGHIAEPELSESRAAIQGALHRVLAREAANRQKS